MSFLDDADGALTSQLEFPKLMGEKTGRESESKSVRNGSTDRLLLDIAKKTFSGSNEVNIQFDRHHFKQG